MQDGSSRFSKMLASMSLQGITCKKTIILYVRVITFLAIYIYNTPYLPEYEIRVFVVSGFFFFTLYVSSQFDV